MASAFKAVKDKYVNMLGQTGRAGLSAVFPYDFEYYMMALELTTYEGTTIDYLAFPVMPNSFSQSEPKRTNVQYTAGGVVALTTPSFTPKQISIRGTFGKDFKILVGDTIKTLGKNKYSIRAGKRTIEDLHNKNLKNRFQSFNTEIKTGYGVIKLLQAIVDKANGVDENGKPFKLNFYNMAMGESWVVVVPQGGLVISQNVGTNMVYDYALNLVAISPIKTTIKNTLITAATAVVNDFGTQLAKDIRRAI